MADDMASDYFTSAELKARFEDDAELISLTDGSGSIDEDVITEVVNSAHGFMNGYLARRYATPISATGDADLASTLRGVGLDIAEVKLMRRGEIVPEAKQRQYDEAVGWLKDVAKGMIVLPAAATPEPSIADVPVADWGDQDAESTSDRLFTRAAQAKV